MKSLPFNLTYHQRTQDFDQDNVPMGMLGRHTTAKGIWGKIKVSEGSLTYRILEPEMEEYVLNKSQHGVVAPQAAHQVEINGPVKFHIEFYRQAA